MTIARAGKILVPLLATALGACAPMPAPETGGNLPPESAQCDAAAASSAVGQTATVEVVEKARTDAGARTARVLKPGQVVTMEYLAGRLNVRVDDANVVAELTCG